MRYISFKYFTNPKRSEDFIVTKIAQGSSAEDVGLVPGEIIVEVDGVAVRSIEDLFKEFHKKSARRKTKPIVMHNAKKRIVKVTLAETL